MKIKNLIYAIVILLTINSVNAQIKTTSTGKVGIGNWGTDNPINELEIKGKFKIIPSTSSSILFSDYYYTISPSPSNTWNLGNSTYRFASIYLTNGVYYGSDERLKENINKIVTPLDKILKINGILFDWKEENFLKINDPEARQAAIKRGKSKFGFLAQEMQQILPNLVEYDAKTDNYCVDYIGIVPVLVEAIKEQQKQIESLKSCCTNNYFKSDSKATNIEESRSIEGAALFQNEPNPFTGATTIRFVLPSTVKTAFIGIYNLQGTQIKKLEINTQGEGSVTINGKELKAGMYFYSLIADGKEVDVKRMVLTD